jgi:hypothetical protein
VRQSECCTKIIAHVGHTLKTEQTATSCDTKNPESRQKIVSNLLTPHKDRKQLSKLAKNVGSERWVQLQAPGVIEADSAVEGVKHPHLLILPHVNLKCRCYNRTGMLTGSISAEIMPH